MLTASDKAPKKYMNSGLRQDVPAKKPKITKAPELIDPLQSGGLDDEDTHATCPSFKPPTCTEAQYHRQLSESHEHDSKRRNNVCGDITFVKFSHAVWLAHWDHGKQFYGTGMKLSCS